MEVANDLTGAVLDGRYKVLEPVAEGAMGIVYRAERLKLGRIVAVKVLHDELPDELSSRKRFEIEAMAMAKLEHPHCAAVLDVGTHDGRPFVVMDFVTGDDLKHVIAQGPMPVARATELLRQVLSGLAHAHELGIIHRDIKPANIILSQKAGLGDHVTILDFGLARLQQEQTSKLTTGIVVGTPAYMAPEQVRGKDIDTRADLYACGILLMELVTGKKPFHSATDDPLEVVSMHLKTPPPTLAELLPGADFGELEAVVAKALAKAADDRYQTATEFVAALDQTQQRSAAAVARAASASELASQAQQVQQVSDSMMIPQGGTQHGLPVHGVGVAGPAPVWASPGAGAAGAPPEPGAGFAPGAPPEAGGGFAPGAPPEAGAGLAPGWAPPGVAPGLAPVGATPGVGAPPPPIASSPYATIAPGAAPPRQATVSTAGLPFTTRQLAIAGGGLVVLVIIIAAIAGGGNGTREATSSAGAASGAPRPEIEMGPTGADPARTLLARAEGLIANGEREAAIQLLTSSRSAFPDNAELPYLAGTLYMGKLWWSEGLKQFRAAIKLEPTYRTDPELIKLVLKGFNTTPSYNSELASFLRDDIGDLARGYLEETAQGHPNAKIRARAQAELKRYP